SCGLSRVRSGASPAWCRSTCRPSSVPKTAATVAEPMVSAVGVRKRFGPTEVLCGIDLEVHTGQVMCIIGPSGSGKSTFLRCINHLEKIDGGRLSVEGE